MTSLEVIKYHYKHKQNDTSFGVFQLTFSSELPPIESSCLKCWMREIWIPQQAKIQGRKTHPKSQNGREKNFP